MRFPSASKFCVLNVYRFLPPFEFVLPKSKNQFKPGLARVLLPIIGIVAVAHCRDEPLQT